MDAAPAANGESRFVDEGATGVLDKPHQRYDVAGADYGLADGDVVIAAITSCTNTSNP